MVAKPAVDLAPFNREIDVQGTGKLDHGWTPNYASDVWQLPVLNSMLYSLHPATKSLLESDKPLMNQAG